MISKKEQLCSATFLVGYGLLWTIFSLPAALVFTFGSLLGVVAMKCKGVA